MGALDQINKGDLRIPLALSCSLAGGVFANIKLDIYVHLYESLL